MKIGQYLQEKGVGYESHQHPPAYTAQEVAAEEHVSGNDFAKTVLIHDDHGYALCVLPACCKLDMEKISKARKSHNIRLADETEMARLFPDAEVGAEAPFGNLYNVPTLVDQRLSENESIVFQAGSHRESIKMHFDDYAKLANVEVADLSIHL